jgi:hypothetical protein
MLDSEFSTGLSRAGLRSMRLFMMARDASAEKQDRIATDYCL